MVVKCAALVKALNSDGTTKRGTLAKGVSISFEVPAIWSCAADKLAEAEKLLAGEKK